MFGTAGSWASLMLRHDGHFGVIRRRLAVGAGLGQIAVICRGGGLSSVDSWWPQRGGRCNYSVSMLLLEQFIHWSSSRGAWNALQQQPPAPAITAPVTGPFHPCLCPSVLFVRHHLLSFATLPGSDSISCTLSYPSEEAPRYPLQLYNCQIPFHPEMMLQRRLR